MRKRKNNLRVMTGKEKCEYLKGIRKRMADAYDIPYEPKECTHESDCNGTCPYCEREAVELMEKIRLKEGEGKDFCIDEDANVLLNDEAKQKFIHKFVEDTSFMGAYCPTNEEKRNRWKEEREAKEKEILRLMEERTELLGYVIPGNEEKKYLLEKMEFERLEKEIEKPLMGDVDINSSEEMKRFMEPEMGKLVMSDEEKEMIRKMREKEEKCNHEE